MVAFPIRNALEIFQKNPIIPVDLNHLKRDKEYAKEQKKTNRVIYAILPLRKQNSSISRFDQTFSALFFSPANTSIDRSRLLKLFTVVRWHNKTPTAQINIMNTIGPAGPKTGQVAQPRLK